MSGHFDDAALNVRPIETIGAMRGKAVTICGIGALATIAGFFLNRDTFFQSYLIGYIFWLGISLGSLGLLMVQHLSGGAWGIVSRRVFESAARTLPLMMVLFLPIAFDAKHLYEWAHPEALNDPIIQQKAAYLNLPFFYARAAFYFAVWIGLTWRFTSWSNAMSRNVPSARSVVLATATPFSMSSTGTSRVPSIRARSMCQ